jgi:hypothetical protein
MPKIITMPTSPWFTNSSFSLSRAIGVTASPFTGKYRTQEFDLVHWAGSVTLPPLSRSQAAEWQSFLLESTGVANYFNFIDPDAKTPTGTYDGLYFTGEIRINGGTNVASVSLSFLTNTITAGSSAFANLVAGDYITVAGADKPENNGTHKVTTATSNTVVVVDTNLVTESNTAACSVKQNVKGSTALTLQANGNTKTGTVKKGDYLAIYDGSATTSNRIQLVMVTADATETSQSGSPNHYSVGIQPKLRADFANGRIAGFSAAYNQSQFRLQENSIQWTANQLSIYGISFDFVEVV